jgi:3-keto-5-aminohexanoate cleavage enzyme
LKNGFDFVNSHEVMNMSKLIVTCAITGGASPESNPYLPKSPKAQAQSALEAWRAGASVIHIHARNPETGKVAHEAALFEEAIVPIREKSDVIINVSTGGTGRRVDGEWLYKKIPQTSCVERVGVIPELSRNPLAKPDLASFNAGSPVIDIYSKKSQEFLLKFVMVHSFPDMVEMARIMNEHDVKPELECYDVSMINNCLFLRDIGVLREPLYFQCVLGILGGIPATVENLIHMVRQIPKAYPWSACSVGLTQWPLVTAAIILGGHARVGMEDNIYLSEGVLAKGNAALVEKIVRIAKELGREIATPQEAREILGLGKSD